MREDDPYLNSFFEERKLDLSGSIEELCERAMKDCVVAAALFESPKLLASLSPEARRSIALENKLVKSDLILLGHAKVLYRKKRPFNELEIPQIKTFVRAYPKLASKFFDAENRHLFDKLDLDFVIEVSHTNAEFAVELFSIQYLLVKMSSIQLFEIAEVNADFLQKLLLPENQCVLDKIESDELVSLAIRCQDMLDFILQHLDLLQKIGPTNFLKLAKKYPDYAAEFYQTEEQLRTLPEKVLFEFASNNQVFAKRLSTFTKLLIKISPNYFDILQRKYPSFNFHEKLKNYVDACIKIDKHFYESLTANELAILTRCSEHLTSKVLARPPILLKMTLSQLQWIKENNKHFVYIRILESYGFFLANLENPFDTFSFEQIVLVALHNAELAKKLFFFQKNLLENVDALFQLSAVHVGFFREVMNTPELFSKLTQIQRTTLLTTHREEAQRASGNYRVLLGLSGYNFYCLSESCPTFIENLRRDYREFSRVMSGFLDGKHNVNHFTVDDVKHIALLQCANYNAMARFQAYSKFKTGDSQQPDPSEKECFDETLFICVDNSSDLDEVLRSLQDEKQRLSPNKESIFSPPSLIVQLDKCIQLAKQVKESMEAKTQSALIF